MFTMFNTIHKTNKEHICYSCSSIIPVGSTCSYGVTTDRYLIRDDKKGIEYGYFCAKCRNYNMNEKIR